MQRCINNAQCFSDAKNAGIDNQCFEPPHVRFIDIVSEHRDTSLPILRKRRERFARDRVYFFDDPAGVRLDHLRAIVEVNFVAVIVRRIMTRGDDDARARSQMTKPRSESSGVERGSGKRNASQPFSDAIFAVSSANSFEKNRVSCATTIFGFARRFLSVLPLVQISDQATRARD